ncbi:MAG: glucose-6-phosphate isomerase [Gammaproteobacteria bacterium]|jgi:glucose-6-phosphate isomerase|nr:glucose-6-phosphate isomerase [Gammaproteobacteria bacterium]
MHEGSEVRSAWEALEAHYREVEGLHLRDLFAREPDRFARMSVEGCGIFMDYSKARATAETLPLLGRLADAVDLRGWTERMFAGEPINETEGRAVLHVALRNRSGRPVRVHGQDVMPDVNEVLARMRRLVGAVRDGSWRGHTGKPIRSVVNLGIGGSDLGPAMAATALAAYGRPDLSGYFVSNLDGTDLAETLVHLDPETTLFVVESKTFTTQETLTNARSARAWLVERLGDEGAVARHFVAVSTSADRVREFGIDLENMFGFWDWVGGRYSVWSAIGLPVAILVGMDRFEGLLAGAHAMDEHFRTAPWERNLPALLGLLRVWYANLFGAPTHAVLPYDYALRLFPAYLQQLEMESNGKRVTRDGRPVTRQTSAVVWGAPGNNGQHAFYQLLHQGTRLVPADFIVPLEPERELAGHHEGVIANALAQTEALMRGRTAAEARAELVASGLSGEALEAAIPHRVLPGNQPTTTLVYQRLTPEILGALVALYEHEVFVQSVVWGINAFDQWGVELGKQLARVIQPELAPGAPLSEHDPSTSGLIRLVRERRAPRG